MFFSCSKCDTRYTLPDEKVAGKVLKVRCKTCEATIVVRDPGEVGALPTVVPRMVLAGTIARPRPA